MKKRQILFLCMGNTCRSPMAEFICKRMAAELNIGYLKILSAGFYVDEDSTLNAYAKTCLVNAGFCVDGFKPTQVGHTMLIESDIIFCMTEQQKDIIQQAYTGIYSSMDFIKQDICDPYGEGLDAYKTVYSQIEEVCNKLLHKIDKNKIEWR